MKTRSAVVMFFGGVLVGVSLALCLGASEPQKPPPQLTAISFPTGTTGFFDAGTGKLYVYDVNLMNCVLIRQITTLGEPMKRVKN